MKKRIIVSLFLFIVAEIYSQSTVTTSGKDISGAGGSIAYTIGQVAYNSNSNSNYTINEGVHQVFEISTVLNLDKSNIFGLSVFPNPTTNQIQLTIKNFNNENILYQLYDVQGRLLEKNSILHNNTIIRTDNFPNAIYFLKLTKDSQLIKTFKIIKK